MGARRRALLQSAPFPYGVSRIPYPGALLRALEGRKVAVTGRSMETP